MKVFGAPNRNGKPHAPRPATKNIRLDDAELIAKIRASRQGAKFDRLWAGDLTDYGGDDSRADLGLCSILAFWAQRDAALMDTLFRQSGLLRDKWLRDDYRERTIQFAIDNCHDVYTQTASNGSRNGHGSNHQEQRDEVPSATSDATVSDDWDYMPLESLPIERMPADLLPGSLGAMVEAVPRDGDAAGACDHDGARCGGLVHSWQGGSGAH